MCNTCDIPVSDSHLSPLFISASYHFIASTLPPFLSDCFSTVYLQFLASSSHTAHIFHKDVPHFPAIADLSNEPDFPLPFSAAFPDFPTSDTGEALSLIHIFTFLHYTCSNCSHCSLFTFATILSFLLYLLHNPSTRSSSSTAHASATEQITHNIGRCV